MTIGKVELEGIRAKYYSVYNTDGEHLFCTDCFYNIGLYGYTATTVTIIDGNNLITYDENGEIIKRTEPTDLLSVLKSNNTPKFRLDTNKNKQKLNPTEVMFKIIGFLIVTCWVYMLIATIFHIPL